MTQIPQLAPIERNLPKSQSDWDRLFTEFLQWQRTIQGMSWQPITLQNNWAALGAGFAPPQYYIDASGRLFCRGLIAPGIVSDGTTLFALPFTPSFRIATLAQAYTGSAYAPVRLDVFPTGAINLYNGSTLTNSGWLSLDQLNFSLIQ
jgi:hypothetical protein